MRILMVNDYPPGNTGGAEVYLDRLVTMLRRAGDEVETLAAPTRRGASRLREVADPLAPRRLRGAVERFRADVVHVHNVTREWTATVVNGAPAGVPVVLTCHDGRIVGIVHDAGPPAPVQRMLGARDRFLLRRRVDGVAAGAPWLVDALRSHGLPDVRLIPPPIEPPSTPPAIPAEPRLLFVGRLAHDKGADVAVEAFAALAGRYPAVVLDMVGPGPAPDVSRLLDGLAPGVRSRVQVLGAVAPEAIAGFLARSQVVLALSRCLEAPGLAPLEAAAAGRPAVVSDTPGIRSGPLRWGAGRVVPAGDAPATAEAIAEYLDDRSLLEVHGQQARAAVLAESAPEVVLDAHHAWYAHVR